MSLRDQVKGFFEAHGYLIATGDDPTFVIAERPTIADEMERTCVWILTKEERKGKDRIILEENYLKRFEGIIDKYPGAKLHLLVDTTEDLTPEFRSKTIGEYGVRIRVPIQFFDMPFRWESAKETATATKALSNAAEKYESKRVPQAYDLKKGVDDGGKDLVTDLMNKLEAALETPQGFVWFIIAPAGQGKSVCFASLFERIFSRFQESKRHFELFPRPLPLVSAHLKEAAGPNVSGLIDAFIRTEFSANSRREFFNWLIDNRYGILMLDGLDEVIVRDTNFVEYLEDRITSPHSRPSIIISMRDSLFETNDDLSTFIADYAAFIQTFYLKAWDYEAKRIHAWLKLENRRPKRNERDNPRVLQYLSSIKKNNGLDRLASTPFYADLMLDQQIESQAIESLQEQNLIEMAIDKMCTREYEKGTLNRDIFPPKSFRDWLEEIAIICYQTGGVSVRELLDLAEVGEALAARELTKDEHDTLAEQLKMVPFFKSSEMTDRLEFTHELIAEYLAGKRFVSYMKSNPAKFAHFVSHHPWPPDSIIFSILGEELKSDIDKLVSSPMTEKLSPEGFRNLVQIIINTDGGINILRDNKLILEGKRLHGIYFNGLDLSGVSFRGADLSNATFNNCNLHGALFEGSMLRKTRFEKMTAKALHSAKFGDCEHFESVFIDGQVIEDLDKFRKSVLAQTGVHEEFTWPCPTARQVQFLFRKFIHIDGQARRNSLDRRGVLRGKQEHNAPSTEDCLREAIWAGYLKEDEGKERIFRASGAKLGEMVALVKDQIASPDMKSMLDSLCKIPGCKHVKSPNE